MKSPINISKYDDNEIYLVELRNVITIDFRKWYQVKCTDPNYKYIDTFFHKGWSDSWFLKSELDPKDIYRKVPWFIANIKIHHRFTSILSKIIFIFIGFIIGKILKV